MSFRRRLVMRVRGSLKGERRKPKGRRKYDEPMKRVDLVTGGPRIWHLTCGSRTIRLTPRYAVLLAEVILGCAQDERFCDVAEVRDNAASFGLRCPR